MTATQIGTEPAHGRVPTAPLVSLFALFAIVAAAVSVFAVLQVDATADYKKEVNHSYQVRRELFRLDSAMYAAEAAAHAGPTAGQGQGRLEREAATARRSLAEFLHLTQDNPPQQQAAKALAVELDEYLSELSRASAQVEPRTPFDGITRAQADVDALIERALAEEARLLADRTQATDASLWKSQALFAGGSALALLSLLAALWLVAGELRRRRKSELALRAQSDLLTATFRSMGQGVLVLDTDMRMLALNPRLREMFEVPDHMTPGNATFADLLQIQVDKGHMTGAERDQRVAAMRAGIAAGGAVRSEFVLRDGRVVEIHRQPYGDGGMVATYTDITERRRTERMKNEFISTVSHELRTPLTSIRGSLGLIVGGAVGELPAKAREMISIAHANSERLVRLINDILDIEKIESGRLQFDLRKQPIGELVAQALKDNTGYFQQYGAMPKLVDLAPGALVRVDGDRFIQVLNNLLSNAAKHTPPEGAVTVSLTRANGRVRLSVKDDGPGIPESFRSRIFGKFEQADSSDSRRKGGTGLGLSIAKAIVERLEGRIWFDSTEGAGTVFHVELPEAGGAPAVPAPPPAGDLDPDDRRPSILVVEDDRDVGHLLSMMLERNGWRVTVAHSAAEASGLLAHGRFAAMTLDIMLPDEDGLSFFRRLRRSPATRDLPVVVVSAKAEVARRDLNGDAIGIVDWLEKPIDQDRLGRAIRQAIGTQAGPVAILHVEDDPDIVRIVGAVMGEAVEVVPATSLAAARAALASRAFSVVIVDVGLPDGSGLDLLGEIRRLSPPPPVVIFSASDFDPASTTQVAAALVKSRTDNDTLHETIQRLIDGLSPSADRTREP